APPCSSRCVPGQGASTHPCVAGQSRAEGTDAHDAAQVQHRCSTEQRLNKPLEHRGRVAGGERRRALRCLLRAPESLTAAPWPQPAGALVLNRMSTTTKRQNSE